ncbi:hypothetical protein MJO28_002127 [Puccinia striiformis f. sp. tritici]|uniref:GH18 domain-containing protein n=2 Tax=Puccinia striiformis f. sp. tritici TaxID=168172 RepID=A0A0L0W323_9BASI|nr:hypothetical protein Pst134EB_003764 [Puccinia striiformis f. sp. tritici]KAI7961638.1 hypothetical protein MJO28_002127 [Puccinia striiformis f. sp. tritici]KAI9610084.1 hypothetical protein H4Q26_007082 [Puccinia striiformis f. sp. tritici PST-130]KNF05943.1 hypothetical protein PSTG_00935 [Puccinia striiformis f. sp. tritici PST-78]
MNVLAFSLLLTAINFRQSISWADRGKQVVSGYYPAYNSRIQPPSKIPWSHYTHIDYFVAPVQNDAGNPLKIEDEKNLKETVQLAKAHNVSISLCIGGWTGSKFFSPLVNTDESRQKFATSLVRIIKEHQFDGIDLDWEYPGVPGQEGNIISPSDTDNFLKFLQILRKKFGPDYRISAAVSVKGFMGADGKYLKDTKAFSKVLDYITIMAYDIYVSGAGAKLSGPNAPLFHTCSDPQSKFSVSGAINTWVKSGFKSKKILLGLPAYGYAYTLLSSELQATKFSGLKQKSSLLFQNITAQPPQGGKISATPGHWLYKELFLDDKLAKDGRRGTSGYKRHFDECSRTPFLFNKDNKNLIVYDDRRSIFEKALFAKSKKLGGINIFDTTGDTPDRKLVETIHVLYSNKKTNKTALSKKLNGEDSSNKKNKFSLKKTCTKLQR